MKDLAVGRLFFWVSQVGRVLRRERRAGVRDVTGEAEVGEMHFEDRGKGCDNKCQDNMFVLF